MWSMPSGQGLRLPRPAGAQSMASPAEFDNAVQESYLTPVMRAELDREHRIGSASKNLVIKLSAPGGNMEESVNHASSMQ